MLLFFFFIGHPLEYGVPGQGLDLSHSCNLCCSCGNIRSFNPPCQTRNQTHILVLQRCLQSHFATAGTPDCCYFFHCRTPRKRSSLALPSPIQEIFGSRSGLLLILFSNYCISLIHIGVTGKQQSMENKIRIGHSYVMFTSSQTSF